MTCGAGLEVSRGEQRKQLLDDRDDRIAEFMRQGRPVAVIAELEGLEEFYTRKATRRIAAERGIEYVPDKEPPGSLLTDETRQLRSHLANVLYAYRNAPGRHQLEVCTATGLTQSEQILATERGGRHDYKLSQIERQARATGQSFKHMMLRGLLTPEEWQKVQRCLNN